MKAKLVKIGNSQGIRIPQAIIEQMGFETSVELTVEDGRLVIAPFRPVRADWEPSFEAMAASADDTPLMPPELPNRFDEEEWTW